MLWIPRLIIVLLCVFENVAEINVDAQAWWNDIFGDGIFRETVDQDVSLHRQFLRHKCYVSKWYYFQNINVNLRHKASSTEDLKTLLQAEKELVNHLNVTKDKLKENTALRKAVDDYLQVVDYDL